MGKIAALFFILLGITAVLLLSTQRTTGARRNGRDQSSNGPFDLYLPVVLDHSAKFTDGTDTLTLDNGIVRVVVDKRWGGAIREIWYDGENLVNNFDGGRLIGVSPYDDQTVPPSGDISDPDWGWNPTPSDIYDHENRPIEYSFANGVLYVKAHNLHWNPNNKGGGLATAVPSDTLVETWIDLPAAAPNGVHIKYRITHDGNDYHARFTQELGFVYVQPAYRRFVRYAGDTPWTNAAVAIDESPPIWPVPHASSTVTENWGGFVNADDFGLIFWAPQAYPRIYYIFHSNPPPAENSTTYMNPMTFREHEPGTVYETEQYLFAGKWQDARAQIYTLRQELAPIPDVQPGIGNIDLPTPDATVGGVIEVAGWALDDRGIQKVEVLLDGQIVGQAQYSQPREDVENDYPGFPDVPDVGFRYWLDTAVYPNGAHTLTVRATDTAGNSSQMLPGEIEIHINN